MHISELFKITLILMDYLHFFGGIRYNDTGGQKGI